MRVNRHKGLVNELDVPMNNVMIVKILHAFQNRSNGQKEVYENPKVSVRTHITRPTASCSVNLPFFTICSKSSPPTASSNER